MVITTLLYVIFCTFQIISGKEGVTTVHDSLLPSRGIPGNEWPPPFISTLP